MKKSKTTLELTYEIILKILSYLKLLYRKFDYQPSGFYHGIQYKLSGEKKFQVVKKDVNVFWGYFNRDFTRKIYLIWGTVSFRRYRELHGISEFEKIKEIMIRDKLQIQSLKDGFRVRYSYFGDADYRQRAHDLLKSTFKEYCSESRPYITSYFFKVSKIK